MLEQNFAYNWNWKYNHELMQYEVYANRTLLCVLFADDPDNDYPMKQNAAELISILPDLTSFFNATVEFLNNRDPKQVVDKTFKITELRSQIYDKIGLLKCGCALKCGCGNT